MFTVLSLFHSGLIFVYFWLGYLIQPSLELLLLLPPPAVLHHHLLHHHCHHHHLFFFVVIIFIKFYSFFVEPCCQFLGRLLKAFTSPFFFWLCIFLSRYQDSSLTYPGSEPHFNPQTTAGAISKPPREPAGCTDIFNIARITLTGLSS